MNLVSDVGPSSLQYMLGANAYCTQIKSPDTRRTGFMMRPRITSLRLDAEPNNSVFCRLVCALTACIGKGCAAGTHGEGQGCRLVRGSVLLFHNCGVSPFCHAPQQNALTGQTPSHRQEGLS